MINGPLGVDLLVHVGKMDITEQSIYLKSIRERAGVSLADMALALGISEDGYELREGGHGTQPKPTKMEWDDCDRLFPLVKHVVSREDFFVAFGHTPSEPQNLGKMSTKTPAEKIKELTTENELLKKLLAESLLTNREIASNYAELRSAYRVLEKHQNLPL